MRRDGCFPRAGLSGQPHLRRRKPSPSGATPGVILNAEPRMKCSGRLPTRLQAPKLMPRPSHNLKGAFDLDTIGVHTSATWLEATLPLCPSSQANSIFGRASLLCLCLCVPGVLLGSDPAISHRRRITSISVAIYTKCFCCRVTVRNIDLSY